MQTRNLAAVLVFGALPAMLPRPALAAEAQLPLVFLDTTYVAPTGRTLAVPAGGDFQAALEIALPGDVIMLEAGATFTGPFVLPNKPGSGWIIVRTSAPDTSLPPPGTRIDPSYATVMPKLVVPYGVGAAVTTLPGAHHFRFIGIEVKPTAGAFVFSLIDLGARVASEETLPHHLIVDRCYIHGDPVMGSRRGIDLSSRSSAVIDSYLADFKEVGADSQAILSWNGPGPFKIVNNYLQAAGENVMFGGVDPTVSLQVPSDIEIRHNHFAKLLAWRIEDPGYAGTPWMVKNLVTLKNARRVLIDGNLFERNWAHEQKGTAIIFTVRNQSGTAPWSTVEDVTLTNNIVRHTGSAIGMHGWDDIFPSQSTKRILIRNNLFDDVSGARWGGAGRLFEANKGIEDLVIDHNTGFPDGGVLIAVPDPAFVERTHTRFVFRNNLTLHGGSGVIGAGTAVGLDTLNTYFPGYAFEGNILVGGNDSIYPPNNFFPALVTDVGFVDLPSRNYRLASSSPYKNGATDGQDIGIDLDALEAATGGVVQGVFTDGSPPTVVPFLSDQPNANGWHHTAVTVSWSVSDDDSGIASSAGCSGVTLDTETDGMTLTCRATNRAGVSASASVTIRIDRTPPLIAITTPTDGAVYRLNEVVGSNYDCSDNLSGVATCVGSVGSGAAVATEAVATNRLSVTAIDRAGNRAVQANTYSVLYDFGGFFSPLENPPVINVVNAGRTVPLKWRLSDARGTAVTDLSSFVSLVSGQAACDASPATLVGEEVTTTDSTALRYDPAAGQFIYHWRTMREWAGCRLLRLTLADGARRDVKIRFR